MNLFKTTSIKRARREFSINMVNDRFIFQNNLIPVFSYFTFMPKTGKGLPKMCSNTVTRSLYLKKNQQEKTNGQ